MSYAKIRRENAAELAVYLSKRNPSEDWRDIVERLQAVARKAHRNAERHCNGELVECPKCKGDGWDCKACNETGYPALAREARAVAMLREALKPYRLRLYEQGDCRGWPLYLIPEESGPESEDASHYNGRGVAVCPH